MNDFLKGQKVTPAPLAGAARGIAPCIEIFVFDEQKINNFRPFFSLNFLKICLKITKKKWVGPIFLRGKGYSYPPTPKIVEAYLFCTLAHG